MLTVLILFVLGITALAFFLDPRCKRAGRWSAVASLILGTVGLIYVFSGPIFTPILHPYVIGPVSILLCLSGIGFLLGALARSLLTAVSHRG